MGKGLDTAINMIKGNYGEGAIMQGEVSYDIPVITTGILSIDLATGVGGIPRGRITEIYGKPGCGKTSLAMHTIAEAQKMGLNAAYIDVEHAIDPTYSRALGVDMEKLFISQPDSGDEALDISEILLRSGEVTIIVVDSVDALVPKSVIEGEMGDKHVADLARLMSQAVRKLNGVVKKANACYIFINQVRANIAIMGYGPKEVTSGGIALKFYASMRMELTSIGKLKDNQEAVIGNQTRIKIVKNKVASPFKEAEVDLNFGKGFDIPGDILNHAINLKIAEKSGSWYAYKGQKLGQGKQATLIYLTENPSLVSEMKTSILEQKLVGK